MESFPTVRAAKEYLIRRILAQAKQDGIALSETERKMLYFSETGWTLPGMFAVNAEFDQKYSEAEYENKIERLIRRLCESQDEIAERDWDNAVDELRTEDHYLLVMIDAAATGRILSARAPGDMRRLILTAAVVSAVLLSTIFLAHSLIPNERMATLVAGGVFAVVLGALLFFKLVCWT